MAKIQDIETPAQPSNAELITQIQKLQQDMARMQQAANKPAEDPRAKWANELGELDRETVETWLAEKMPVGVFFKRCEKSKMTIQEEREAIFHGGKETQRALKHVTLEFQRYDGVGAELFVNADSNIAEKWSQANIAHLGEVSISENEKKEFDLPSATPIRQTGRISFSEAYLKVLQSHAYRNGQIITGEAFMMICEEKYRTKWGARESAAANKIAVNAKLKITEEKAQETALKLGKIMTPAGE